MTDSLQSIRRLFHAPTASGLLVCLLLGVLQIAIGCDDTRTVLVKTHPAGASVFINGKLAGASPCKVQWEDARPDDLWELHVIEVKAKGYEPQRKEIRYRTGEAWLPDSIELKLISTDGLALADEELLPEPPKPATTWTPKKETEIPVANNIPSKSKPAKAKPALAKKKPAKEIKPAAKVKKTVAVNNTPAPVKAPEPKVVAAPAPEQVGPPKPTLAKAEGKTKPEAAFSIWRPKGRSNATPEIAAATPRNHAEIQGPVRPAKSAPVDIRTSPGEVREYEDISGYDDNSDAGRLFACEVKLVRLSDGRVLAQASLLAPYDQRNRIADVLVKLLAKDAPDDATVAVGCLSNRRREPSGRSLCDEMTHAMIRAVRQTPGLRYVKQVNLRNVILDEQMVESPKVVADHRIAYLFRGADHVIVGGAAMAIPIRKPVRLDDLKYTSTKP